MLEYLAARHDVIVAVDLLKSSLGKLGPYAARFRGGNAERIGIDPAQICLGEVQSHPREQGARAAADVDHAETIVATERGGDVDDMLLQKKIVEHPPHAPHGGGVIESFRYAIDRFGNLLVANLVPVHGAANYKTAGGRSRLMGDAAFQASRPDARRRCHWSCRPWFSFSLGGGRVTPRLDTEDAMAEEDKSLDQLIIALNRARAKKRAEWNRRVSIGDLLTDRRQNAREYGWGDGTTCYDNVLVIGEVRVGRKTWIGPNVILDGSGGLEIGDFCSIDAGVQIYSHDSVNWAISMGDAPYDYAPTKIGSGVFIGPNTVIAKGVTIGDRVVIGAMSFVNRDIPSGMKAVGQPARIIGSIGSS